MLRVTYASMCVQGYIFYHHIFFFSPTPTFPVFPFPVSATLRPGSLPIKLRNFGYFQPFILKNVYILHLRVQDRVLKPFGHFKLAKGQFQTSNSMSGCLKHFDKKMWISYIGRQGSETFWTFQVSSRLITYQNRSECN